MTDAANSDSEPGDDRRQSIFVVSDDAEFQQQVRSRLSTVPDYDINESSVAKALSSRNSLGADLVLFEVGDGSILDSPKLLDFRRSFTTAPFIVVSGELSAEHIRRLVQLSGADWLRRPLESRTLLHAVAQQLKGTHFAKTEICAFLPCSSGAGATSLAISASAHLANRRGGQLQTDTCLVDLDFAFGSCGQYLDLVNDYSLDSVLRDPERMDLELLDIIEQRHKSGFSLLSFFRPRVPLGQIREDFVLQLLDVVCNRYPHVVIDMPPYPTDWTDQVLRDCDRVILVTEFTVPGLKYSREAYRHVTDLRKGNKGVYVVVNKTRQRWFSAGIRPKEAKNVFKKGFVRFLPEDHKVMSEALNRGVPAWEINKRSKLVRRLGSLLNEVWSNEPA